MRRLLIGVVVLAVLAGAAVIGYSVLSTGDAGQALAQVQHKA